MGPKFNGWCLYKRKERDRHTQAHKGENPMTMEAEASMMPLQAQEHQRLHQRLLGATEEVRKVFP